MDVTINVDLCLPSFVFCLFITESLKQYALPSLDVLLQLVKEEYIKTVAIDLQLTSTKYNCLPQWELQEKFTAHRRPAYEYSYRYANNRIDTLQFKCDCVLFMVLLLVIIPKNQELPVYVKLN